MATGSVLAVKAAASPSLPARSYEPMLPSTSARAREQGAPAAACEASASQRSPSLERLLLILIYRLRLRGEASVPALLKDANSC